MNRILPGHALNQLRALPDNSVDCVVTSPPYWGLRDYNHSEQIGLEATFEEYVTRLREIFSEVHRVLKSEGTLWLNLGDTYMGYKHQARESTELSCKNLVGIPWRVAFALQNSGWILRSDIIWAKPNPLPESVRDRPTKSHEYIFLFSKSKSYYYDADAIREPLANSSLLRLQQDVENQKGSSRIPEKANGTMKAVAFGTKRDGIDTRKGTPWEGHKGANKRSVWNVPTKPSYKEEITPEESEHFATFSTELITPCILAGCPQGGIVLDPFAGTGTTGEAAASQGRQFLLIELNPIFVSLMRKRLNKWLHQTCLEVSS